MIGLIVESDICSTHEHLAVRLPCYLPFWDCCLMSRSKEVPNFGGLPRVDILMEDVKFRNA